MPMAEKRNPGRFTIQFDLRDPQHNQVAQLLEGQGRYKARFITNAVMHYLHCPETPDIPQPAPVDKDLLEKLVLEIMGRHKQKEEPSGGGTENSIVKQPPVTHEPDEELQLLFGTEGMAMIANTLAAFQKT